MLKNTFLFVIILQIFSLSSQSNSVVLCASDVIVCEKTGQDLSSCLSTSDACNKVRTENRWGLHECNKACNRFFCRKDNTPNPSACSILAKTIVDGKALCPEDKVKNCLEATESLSKEQMEDSKKLVIGMKAAKEIKVKKGAADESGLMSKFKGFFK